MSVHDAPLLQVEGLQVRFPVRTERRKAWVHAVEDVSFSLAHGETLGLVGESGSGKSTIGNALLGLVPPTAGRILLDGHDVTSARGPSLRELRRRVTMVFQDPLASLDPRRTIEDSVREPLEIHRLSPGRERGRRVADLLDLVGLPRRFADHYPHELSGGQRQRVCIARALAGDPEIVVLDEATASLDVSVQAQIMNLLQDLQRDLGLSYLFISHDLAAVEHMSHRVQVMYLGRLMESAGREEIYAAPGHPYTQALLSAIPADDPVVERGRRRILLRGDVPSPVSPPSGCVFRTRCPLAIDVCAERVPEPVGLGAGHVAACVRAGERVPAGT
ncbi:ABC transporter ATP-binding protein [Oerskovia flava]|uniref:ABC transporter ATP-binding protein n=1 Tax=Oerskovia flava TaxID=2986422 RepID=UPI00223EA10C|nr:ABC transporter ATP-binding protein [Oerskovia sp. JB1-3-2]